MGGVIEGGVGIVNKTSPRKAAIEKVQAYLRQEYDYREEKKRELEFLEQGGDPLEFMLGNAAPVIVQSTSFTDQHRDQLVISEAKGSVAFTASPHGDSAESSGRPGPPPCEPNSADNLMLFDAENEHSSQMDASHKNRELGDSTAFSIPRKAYRRRNRSRPNRDVTRMSTTDVNPTCGSHGSSLPSRYGPREVKGLQSGTETLNISLNRNSKPKSPIDDTQNNEIPLADGLQDMELDGLKSVESTKEAASSDAIASKTPLDDQLHQESPSAATKSPTQFDGAEVMQGMEVMSPSTVIEFHPSLNATKAENQFNSCQMNRINGDGVTNDAHNSSALCGIKGLDSELSSNQTCLSYDGNNDSVICPNIINVDSNGTDATPIIESDKFVDQKKDTEGIDGSTRADNESTSACQSEQENGFVLREEELNRSITALQNEEKDKVIIEVMEASVPTAESGKKPNDHVNSGPKNEASSDIMNKGSISDMPEAGLSTSISIVTLEAQTPSGPDMELAKKIDEDSILKEAEIIKAKRKRMAELSVGTFATEVRRKSQWDYVLEEIAWLANDFAQERIWKIAAAAQISHRAAFACRLRKQENSFVLDAKKVSHTLTKAVMEFWHSVEIQIQETSNELDQQSPKNGTLSVQAYALRFLKHNKPNIHDQMPLTPNKTSDSGTVDLSWEDNLTEEKLFYAVSLGAVEAYRKSIESHVAHCKRIGSCMQGVETSAGNAAAGFESQYKPYDEDEGETSTYNISAAFEGCKSSSSGQQRRNYLTNAYGSKSYEIVSDLLPVEKKIVTQQSTLLAKRPGSSLKVSIPTKRLRTAARRVISPFNAVGALPNKADASSGDTSSFQDDQSTLRGGFVVPNSFEAESVGHYDEQLTFDSAEVTKPKKKKKAKHLNAAYEHKWQVDSSFQTEQKDHLKKRYDRHQLDSNGNNDFLGQPVLKKPKIMRQSQDNSFDNIPPSGGSVPSPVASQSNMSNSNKFMKMLQRGRKAKVLKMPSGQLGSGSDWSLFEDQALVVLAHDLGPNWELVSDAMNSTLHFKCIFRKAKECKERHNFLMDRTSGDGADSAEDSGSSQAYPSSLPGIPKGSARQLFQRLQGPMEEDTLKSHFEKIIMIGQKQLYRKTQDPNQLVQPHSSHSIALSQVCQNNLNGGPILTPLDLCDATIPGPDIFPLGYHGPQSGGLAMPNQGSMSPMLPASGAISSLQGSPNTMIGNNVPSSPGPLNSSVRDGRYMVPRSTPLSADEQQRMQQYNQMIPGRNIPHPNPTASGTLTVTDRGARILPGGNGVGMVNRKLPIGRPGFQGIAASPIGMPSASMHSGIGAAQGSSMLRPREALHMMRPDFQMPGNSQGASLFGGIGPPPVSSYPLHQHPSHLISPQPPHHPQFQGPVNHLSPSPQQQANAKRLAKEKKPRFLQQQQQQQQCSTSDSLTPQPQLPISSPIQNSPQIQSQTTLSTMQKQQTPTQGVVRNVQSGGSGLTNQTGKQRQRQQQFPQANRQQHPQQKQQSRQPQQSKVAKGVGRGSKTTNQNVPNDFSTLNGVSTNPASHFHQDVASQTSNQSLPHQKMYSVQAASALKHPQVLSHSDNSSQGRVPSLAVTESNHQQKPAQQKLVNQNQPALQKVAQTNRQINSDPSTKSHFRDSSSDQRQSSISSDMDTVTTLPQACNDASNLGQFTSELDSNVLSSAEPNSSESIPQASQGLDQRPSSASLPPSRHDVSAQWQQNQHSQVQQPQQQAQLLQAGNGNLYGRSSDTHLE